tara:strand:+ start:64 stop:510 length:447 start_codon:yes stop_codon:yes gene_type:complete
MQKYLVILFLLFFPASLLAQEENHFLMLKNNEVNVRYGPSFEYPIKYIYKKTGLPLRVIDKKENFRRIIDNKKNGGWIHLSQLKKSKSFITTEIKILFKKPTKFSKPLAKIDKGRLLRVKECKDKWCNVKSGKFSGWIEKDNVWGFIN